MLCFSDPNTVETLRSFQECIEWAVNGSFSDDDIDEAKLGVFSQVSTSDITHMHAFIHTYVCYVYR